MEGVLLFFPFDHVGLHSWLQGSAKLCVTGSWVSFRTMILLWDSLFSDGCETHDSVQNFLASIRLVFGVMNQV